MGTRRIFLRFVLAALLLFAQHVALTHAIWHAHDAAPEQHEDSNTKGSLHAGSCEWHGAFGQLLGGVPSDSAPHAGQHGPAEQAAPPALPRVAALTPSPLSRGPPALL